MRPIVLPVVQYSGPEHDVKLPIRQYKGIIPEFSIDLKRPVIHPAFFHVTPSRLVVLANSSCRHGRDAH